MLQCEHDFAIAIYNDAGKSIGCTPVSPDWAPLAEHVHFAGIRRGVLPPVMSQPPGCLTPVWQKKPGAPYVGGVRIEMQTGCGNPFGETFSIGCFKAEAKRVAAGYVTAGKLKDGELFQYTAVAIPRKSLPDKCGRMALLDVEEIEQPLTLIDSDIRAFADRSTVLSRQERPDNGALPVFIAQELVAQCVDLVRAAGSLETGGILVGRMRRDASAGLFLEITAQIPAEHSRQEEMQVTFTDKTWAAARDTLAQRRSDEAILGWFHSHPDFCATCNHEKRDNCTLNGIFFSKTDISLHRTMFPRAWHVGLLFSNRPAGIIPALFGWDRGEVVARPFHLLAQPNQQPDPQLLTALGTSDAPILATVGGDEHATQ